MESLAWVLRVIDRLSWQSEFHALPIAEVAMWLIDHQMNMLICNEFGQYFARLPLKKAAKIVHGNALQMDWKSIIKKDSIYITAENTTIKLNEPQPEYTTVNIKTNNLTIIDERSDTKERIEIGNTFDYILGNPPFIGSKIMNQNQRDEVIREFGNITGAGVLDYVTAWYVKAAKFIQNTNTKCAFVSTNSITQGEQVGILWNVMLNMYGIKIHFAHRTFKWSNEAKGNAAVFCVIIGFANYDTNNKSIFEYENIKGEAHEIKAKNINPYLVDAKDLLISKRRKPICKVPEIAFGSMPNDGGFLLLSNNDKDEICSRDTIFSKYVRPLLSGKEFLNNILKWCLWLEDFNPGDIAKSHELRVRIDNVFEHRSKSTRETTRKLAQTPYLFGELRQPKNDYVVIPRVSSGDRKIIPMGIFTSDFIVGDTCLSVENATLYHFGILQSSMHMAWVNQVCGRLKGDYRYSNEIVYNNFPWPFEPLEKQINSIEEKASQILRIRQQYSQNSLDELYKSKAMPPALLKAHNELDKAVDLAYRPQPFASEANRMVYLFELYEKYTADLFTKEKKKKKL